MKVPHFFFSGSSFFCELAFLVMFFLCWSSVV